MGYSQEIEENSREFLLVVVEGKTSYCGNLQRRVSLSSLQITNLIQAQYFSSKRACRICEIYSYGDAETQFSPRLRLTQNKEFPHLSKTLLTGEDVEKLELSFIADWSAKWHSHFREQIDSFLQN